MSDWGDQQPIRSEDVCRNTRNLVYLLSSVVLFIGVIWYLKLKA
jgi:hypothetical protein